MKRLLILAATILTGCTVTVRPLSPSAPTKKKTHRTVKRNVRHGSGVQPEKPEQSTVVDSAWVTRYKELEASHGGYTHHADREIETLPDGRVRVPKSVLDHNRDLERTPLPSPTPKP